MDTSLRRFVDRLGYNFLDPLLLQQALTHRSHGATNNERLEFLGDAVLGMIVSNMLYQQFRDVSEGDLSRLRAALVNGEALASMAREFGFGEHLRLGSGELKTGGVDRDSILAGAFEAIIGAIQRDGGSDSCRENVERWFAPRMDKLSLVDHHRHKDSKSRLQEYMQGRGEPLPIYELVGVSGEGHAQQFEVRCCVKGLHGEHLGCASSRRKAEQAAASVALEALATKGTAVNKR